MTPKVRGVIASGFRGRDQQGDGGLLGCSVRPSPKGGEVFVHLIMMINRHLHLGTFPEARSILQLLKV